MSDSEVVVSESKVRDAVESILAEIDLSTVTFRQIREKLASEYSIDAADKKEFVLQLVEEFMTRQQADTHDESSNESDSDQEEPDASKANKKPPTKGDKFYVFLLFVPPMTYLPLLSVIISERWIFRPCSTLL